MWAELASFLLRPTFFMLVAFVVTFLVTRYVTHMIRSGRGPFRDNTVGGVHIHHEVYGIFLLLSAGALEFAYRPDPPGVQVLATLFGVGAALTLDEFALWLHLDDVYWGPEGRRSVDAVLVAVIVGGLMLVEAAPWDVDASDGDDRRRRHPRGEPAVHRDRPVQGPDRARHPRVPGAAAGLRRGAAAGAAPLAVGAAVLPAGVAAPGAVRAPFPRGPATIGGTRW